MVLKHSAILKAVLVSSLAHWRRDRDEPAAEYGSSPDSPLGRAGFEPSVPLRWCGGSRPLRSTTFGCAFPRKTDEFCERDRRFESCPPAEIQDKRREHAVASVGKHVHKGDQLAHIICRPWRYAFAELDQQTRLEPRSTTRYRRFAPDCRPMPFRTHSSPTPRSSAQRGGRLRWSTPMLTR